MTTQIEDLVLDEGGRITYVPELKRIIGTEDGKKFHLWLNCPVMRDWLQKCIHAANTASEPARPEPEPTNQAAPLVVSPGRYRRRDGSEARNVKECCACTHGLEEFPFIDDVGLRYRRDGRCNRITEMDLDLIERLPDAKPEPPPAIEAGEGWRLLETGEPVLEGDEYFVHGRWDWSGNWDTGKQAPGYTYRRRVPPAKAVEPVKLEAGKWYARPCGAKFLYVGIDQKGRRVFDWQDGIYRYGDSDHDHKWLSELREHREPRTWTRDVIVYTIRDEKHVHCDCFNVGHVLLPCCKEIHRQTITLTEQVNQ